MTLLHIPCEKMSDTDSLDGLLDDIDVDTLLDSKEPPSSALSAQSNNGKAIENEADLDDLLDDFFEDDDTPTAKEKGEGKLSPTSSGKSANNTNCSDDIDDDGGLTAHLQLQKSHELERALHTIPNPDTKNKWMNILNKDIKLDTTTPSSSFKHSYAYLEWQDPVEHFAVDKALRNLILRACSKSQISDTQAKRLQDALFDDPVLLKKYCRQIIEAKSQEIKTDVDFNEDKYPSLWKSIM